MTTPEDGEDDKNFFLDFQIFSSKGLFPLLFFVLNHLFSWAGLTELANAFQFPYCPVDPFAF